MPSRQITIGTNVDDNKINAPEFGDKGEELIVEEADAAEGNGVLPLVLKGVDT